MFRFVVMVITLGSIALVIAGFGASVHRAGDSLALLRPIAGVACGLGCVLARGWWLRTAAGIAAVVSAVTIVPFFASQPAGGDLRLYSKNLNNGNQTFGAVADDILASDVDVVMLQEVSDRNRAILNLLSVEFPHQHLCRFSGWSGVAVLSRSPIVSEARCSTVRGLAAAQIEHEGAAVWVASVHIHWPWPKDTEPAERAVLEVLAAISGPVVVAGDFNIFPWSKRVGDVVDAAQGRLAGPVAGTYSLRGLPLPIDHVVAPGGGQVALRPGLGSDHRGLVADVSLAGR